jgi:hypothetical protein
MTDRELMQMALDALETSLVFVTTREKIKDPEGREWYDERIKALRDRLAKPEPDCKPDFDLLFEANSADIEALQDAQFTLEAIKSADPGTHDEIIDASLRLIKVALSKSVFGPIERIAERIGIEI